jgi:hypothetical protein
MKDPRFDIKMRKQKPVPTETHESAVTGTGTSSYHSPRSHTMTSPKEPTTLSKRRAVASARARCLNRYHKTKEEIDQFIRDHYEGEGPSWIAAQLGMKPSAVSMRARGMGLKPLC